MVGGVKDTVNNRVPHDKVRRSHVNLGTEALFSILVLAFLHFLEKLQVFFYGTISPGTFLPRMFQIAAGIMDFLTALIIYISQPHADELAGKLIEFREIVGSEMHRFLPLESQPLYIFQNGIHKLLIFLRRVRIIETNIGGAMILFTKPKI